MGFFRKPFVYAGLFTLCLLAFTAYAQETVHCTIRPT